VQFLGAQKAQSFVKLQRRDIVNLGFDRNLILLLAVSERRQDPEQDNTPRLHP